MSRLRDRLKRWAAQTFYGSEPEPLTHAQIVKAVKVFDEHKRASPQRKRRRRAVQASRRANRG